tara:strand:+ start:25 stop:525 length:501 start_codon:yes stop_codon:yes gene_type:complete
MKKLLGIVVLISLIPTVSNASVLGNYLSTKDGAENRIYNLVIGSYNNFKRNFKSEVLDYCKNQMISGGGINQIIQQTKCEYNAAVDLLSSNDINFDPMSEITWNWHQDAHPMSKTVAVTVHRCSSSSCKSDTLNNYAENKVTLLTSYFRKMDRGVKRIALEANEKY